MGLATAGRRLVPRNALAAAGRQDMGDAPAERPDRGTLLRYALQSPNYGASYWKPAPPDTLVVDDNNTFWKILGRH
jgi:hypothetical protein